MAASHRPFSTIRHWLAQAQAVRARRQALTALLELDSTRLDDLGISRDDVLEAMLTPSRSPGRRLTAARARNARQ